MSSPNPESSGPPLRALAMVLISLAILFAAIGALSLTGTGSDEVAAPAATTQTSQAPAASAAPTTTAAPKTSVDPADVELQVLNNSSVSGLAAETAATLTAEGWTVTGTGNYAEMQVPATTVYYGSAAGAQVAAQQIAQQLGATTATRPATLSAFGDGVIVMVTQ
ncbi:LytR C-terminal domain-containing protein [Rhodococcus sp. G-MC3]|uniref:LytR C-terminal domain-containing protein n=1 Tax=Rhodococcus sp. G-MC3 TaxID=3046209 RepID=UPI0024BB5EF5|nr:LytR C-terminal domain-containing protein [Rhodococcus sp. G-MC3]MDJ0393246.1 LytR C-terminal domain-containing protein [Rhodococcus sp. G-MC3]